MKSLNITNIANGALVEQTNIEIEKVVANLLDLNTDIKKKRKITIVLEFKADDERELSKVKFTVKSELAPQTPVSTTIAYDRDGEGKIVVEELKKNAAKGQFFINNFGEIVEPQTSNKNTGSRIVNIK